MLRLEVMTASLEDPRVVYALVRLHAEGRGETRAPGGRRPVNLALVIDRSSSMRGPRLVQAALAARRLVERLGPEDRLSVVTFDAHARTLVAPGPVTDEAKSKILAEIATLDTGAGTNLAAGLRKGGEHVVSGYVRDGVSRIVLLTDGLPSIGPQDPEKLGELADAQAKRGITVTSMGIGEGFDDELLGEIARRGRGGFYYLATPEAIPAAFGRELAGVFAVAASEVTLKIVPEGDVAQCEVRHRVPVRADKDGLVVDIGDIAEGAPRQVLLRLVRREVEPGKLLAKLVVMHRADAAEVKAGLEARDKGVEAHRGGEPHLDRIVAPERVVPAHVAEVAAEHLRIAVASAVDEAWARRAGGKRSAARAALAEVRSAVEGARERGLVPREMLVPLLAELDEADQAVSGGVREAEQHRRAARERSFVTMVGMSVVKPLADLGRDGDASDTDSTDGEPPDRD